MDGGSRVNMVTRVLRSWLVSEGIAWAHVVTQLAVAHKGILYNWDSKLFGVQGSFRPQRILCISRVTFGSQDVVLPGQIFSYVKFIRGFS